MSIAPFIYDRIRRIPLSLALVLVLMVIGGYLRLKSLSFQSLWLDELNTMIEARPGRTIHEVLAFLKRIDPHPPLYFLLIHHWFQVVGYNEFTARMLSAIVGTLTIPVAFFLGKEIYSRGAGCIAAVLTTFNYYNIFYSQEARDYIFAFFFSCLSFIFFVRALRNISWKSSLSYALSTSLLLYTHYYGFMVLGSQIVIAGIFVLMGAPFKKYLIHFGMAFLAILLLYLPWLPTVFTLGQRKSLWIPKPKPNFFVDYFWDYFGQDIFTGYTIAFLLIVFLGVWFFRQQNEQDAERKERYTFSFVVLVTWVLVSYLIPYVKSLISLPLLVNRYTIVTLPGILLCAAIGVEQLSQRMIKIYFVVLIVLFSIIHLFFYNRYYVTPTRTQWREMTAFVVRNNPQNYPIVSDRSWHLPYYFGVAKYKPRFVPQDSIKMLNEFWVVTGHVGHPLNDQNKEIVNRDFEVKKSFKGIGTSAQFFSRKRMALDLSGGSLTPDGYHALFDGGRLNAEPLPLAPGEYNLVIYGYGTRADNEYPKLRVMMNNKTLREFYISDRKDYFISFELTEKMDAVFSLEFLNDAVSGAVDRKLFVKFAEVERMYPPRFQRRDAKDKSTGQN